MIKIKYLLQIIFIYSVSFSNPFKSEINENEILLKLLYSNSNWQTIKTTDDSILVSQKEIRQSNLNAIKVEKIVSIDPESFTDVIMNVNDYNSFLTNAKSFKSKVISSTFTDLVAYQHIIIDFPFINDREYYFYMSRKPFSDDIDNIMCFWTLLNPQQTQNLFKKNNCIYLEEGAGLWKWEKIKDSKDIKITYALSMHPGGDLPKFLIDMINQNSIVGLFRDVENKVFTNKRNSNL